MVFDPALPSEKRLHGKEEWMLERLMMQLTVNDHGKTSAVRSDRQCNMNI